MTIVIKLGGELLAPARSDTATRIARDVHALVRRGAPVVIVHGGGPQTSALQRRLGQEPNVVGGRRITDSEALDAIKMTVAGKLNADLCATLVAQGVKPVGINGASSRVVAAVKRPPRQVSGCGDAPVDFGHVGDVVGIDDGLLKLLIEGGYTPVLACLGCGDQGQLYNINADIVATQLASALAAETLLLVTGAPGVLTDIDDPTSRIARLTVEEAKAAIVDGTVVGGMIPKLEESFNAIAAGVSRIVILDGEVLRAVDEPGAVGTSLVA
jgi:acetylglutamate kinase